MVLVKKLNIIYEDIKSNCIKQWIVERICKKDLHQYESRKLIMRYFLA